MRPCGLSSQTNYNFFNFWRICAAHICSEFYCALDSKHVCVCPFKNLFEWVLIYIYILNNVNAIFMPIRKAIHVFPDCWHWYIDNNMYMYIYTHIYICISTCTHTHTHTRIHICLDRAQPEFQQLGCGGGNRARSSPLTNAYSHAPQAIWQFIRTWRRAGAAASTGASDVARKSLSIPQQHWCKKQEQNGRRPAISPPYFPHLGGGFAGTFLHMSCRNISSMIRGELLSCRNIPLWFVWRAADKDLRHCPGMSSCTFRYHVCRTHVSTQSARTCQQTAHVSALDVTVSTSAD